MNKYFAAVAACGALAPFAAQAGESPLYVGVAAGLAADGDHLFEGANLAGAPRRIETPVKDGSLAAITLGVVAKESDWGRVRVEAEIGRRYNKVDRLVLNSVERQLLEGRKEVTSALVNVAYDTPLYWDRVRFTLAAGAGLANVDYDVRYLVAASGPAIAIPTGVSTLAFQSLVGVQYALNENIELTADLRHLKLDDHQVERFNHTAGTLDSVLDADYSTTGYAVGVRYRF
jgi:opacity protein-like surface antigen